MIKNKSFLWKKYLLRAFAAVFLTMSLALASFHMLAPRMLLHPTKRLCQVDYDPTKFQATALNGFDDIILQGYESMRGDSSKGTLILLHGIGGCARSMLGLSEILRKAGYNSIALDNRAHGRSGGEYCTYGYYEKYDVKAIVDYILEQYPDEYVGIWGNSLGGAIAIQALELDERIQFGIIESTFSDFRTIVLDYKKRLFGVRVPFLADYAIARASKIADFEAEAIRPMESVKEIEQPVFIAHGDKDQRIDVSYGKTLFENLNSAEKELLIVEGGRHSGLSRVVGEEYWKTIINFIEKTKRDEK
ncbi:MAG: alpha/beta fold hydrolase [Bacteroidota bacterium]